MDTRGTMAAAMLDPAARVLAAAAAVEVRERLGEEAVPGTFTQLVEELQLRVRHLSEALATGQHDLFRGEVTWARATHEARGVPGTFLATCLDSLDLVITERLPDHLAGLAREVLEHGRAALEGPAPVVPSRLGQGPQAPLAQRFLFEALRGHAPAALALLRAARAEGVPAEALRHEVLRAVQHEVGRMWQHGEVNIAEEHHVSGVVREALGILRERPEEATGRTVVVFSVAGDLHDIGARVIADRFEAEGWHVVYLGADVPAEAACEAVVDFGADLVAVSVSQGLHMRALARTVEAIHTVTAGAVPVLVGGRPFEELPGLAAAVGADACATDADEAAAAAARLVG